ncbi:MAG: hypothetical protein ABEJ23_06420 [Haloarculaceae archaeon]
MSTKTSAGLQNSGTDASKEDRITEISELIELHESTDWSDVPGVSTAEAGAWTARLIEARDRVQEGL